MPPNRTSGSPAHHSSTHLVLLRTLDRPRVVQKLQRAAVRRITLLVAPAGFGKSVALRQMLQREQRQTALYSLRPENEHLAGFVRGLSRALSDHLPDQARTAPLANAAASRSETPVEDLADWFTTHLAAFEGNIAIDDFHISAGDALVCRFLALAIDRGPSCIKWFVSTRDSGSLPVAKWQRDEQMGEPIAEGDLVFTMEEARSIASQELHAQEMKEVASIYDVTRGWPVAFRFAAELSGRVSDLGALVHGTRDLMYRFLAEQVFSGLDERLQEFVLSTCVYPRLDILLLRNGGFEDCEVLIADLYKRTTFVQRETDHIFRYHDLFREFLEERLRRSSARGFVAALEAAGELYEASGDMSAALNCYTRAGSGRNLRSLLEENGLALIESGYADVVDAAIETLAEGDRRRPINLALCGILAANRGDVNSAVAAFQFALARSEDGLEKAWISHLFARSTPTTQDPTRIVELLAPLAADRTLPADLDVMICSLLACGYARLDQGHLAQPLIVRALGVLPQVTDIAMRTTVYQRAGLCAWFAGDASRAKQHTVECSRLAEGANNLRIAAAAHATLSTVVFEAENDVQQCMHHLEQCRTLAVRAGNVEYQLGALWVGSYLEAERGDQAALDEIDARLVRLARHSNQSSLASPWRLSQALRKAWEGDFERALDLAESARGLESSHGPAWRALRSALAALFASAGQLADAPAALAEADRETAAMFERAPNARAYRALALHASALAIAGRFGSTNHKLRRLQSRLPAAWKQLRPLEIAGRALVAHARSGLGNQEIAAALGALRASGFGGYASVLARASLGEASAVHSFATLTAAEVEVLKALDDGETSRSIAERTGRHKSTIDGHVDSIRKKLGCVSRREAIAIARKLGHMR